MRKLYFAALFAVSSLVCLYLATAIAPDLPLPVRDYSGAQILALLILLIGLAQLCLTLALIASYQPKPAVPATRLTHCPDCGTGYLFHRTTGHCVARFGYSCDTCGDTEPTN